MSLDYDNYLTEHVKNVQKALTWMSKYLDLDQNAMSVAMDRAMLHDASKTTVEEYDPYDYYFYGGNRSYQVKKDFDCAWLHHIHQNPHHWQYWILFEDDPTGNERDKALEMPLPYVYEMIADWWTFSWKDGDLHEIFKWYSEHNGEIVMHKKTEKLVRNIFEQMRAKLGEKEEGVSFNNIRVEHSDLKEEDEHQYGVPEQKKFPLPDADHVKSAIRFFNYVDPKYEKELAKAILEKAKEYGVVLGEDITVGDDNRFKNYIPKEDKE